MSCASDATVLETHLHDCLQPPLTPTDEKISLINSCQLIISFASELEMDKLINISSHGY
jgi:hypothetical protein